MPLIDVNPVPVEIPSLATIEEKLKKALPAAGRKDKHLEVFDNAGASVENAAEVIANVMAFSSEENTKLRAAELVLKVHKIMDDKGNTEPQINFVFHEAVNLQQILQPRTNT